MRQLLLPERRVVLPRPPSYIRGDWRFGEGSGTALGDRSRYRNHGTISGATWATSKAPGALTFDGVLNYVSIPHAASISFTGAMGVALWCKPAATQKGYCRLIHKIVYPTSGWDLYLSSSRPTFSIHDNVVDPEARGATAINDGEWHFVAGTYDLEYLRLYQDAAAAVTTAYTAAIVANTHALEMGSLTQYAGDREYAGDIALVRLWGVCPSASEIAAYRLATT